MMNSVIAASGSDCNCKGGERGGQISDRTVARVRWYLYVLEDLERQGVSVVSSQTIAEKLGVTSGLVRKDLCHFGGFGRPSIGYNVGYLKKQIREILHINEVMRVAWVGVRRLVDDPGALRGLGDGNRRLVAVFDAEPERTFGLVGGLAVMGLDRIASMVRELCVDAAVVAVPDSQAQGVADELVAGGVKAILNLSSSVLRTPPGVAVRSVDISGELVLLSYYCGESQTNDL